MNTENSKYPSLDELDDFIEKLNKSYHKLTGMDFTNVKKKESIFKRLTKTIYNLWE